MGKTLKLTSKVQGGATVIPNLFFDEYLPRANGEFLKIYLYLYRWMSSDDSLIDIERIADMLNMTEKDVCRALRYWENEGLLSLEYGDRREITEICLNSIFTDTVSDSLVQSGSDRSDSDLYTQSVDPEPHVLKPEPPAINSVSGEIPGYDMTEIANLADSMEGEELLMVIQVYLGHPLSSSDLNLVYYFYDELGFSCDLIEYLFEHCVGSGHRSMKYIQAVALAWHEAGITTRDQAKTHAEGHMKDCYAVMRAFGLSGRKAVDSEITFVNKWTGEYGFSQEIILEACNRTMKATHTPSFEYTDRILANWKAKGAYTMSEIAALDQAHAKAASPSKTVKTHIQTRQTRQPANRFHNYKQRSYNFDELEMELFRKSQGRTGSGN